MRTILLLAGLSVGATCQDPKRDAQKAILGTRSQTSFHSRFTARIDMPNGNPLKIKGESVWVRPGILWIQYTGSGGDEKRIIRVGKRVWIYHEFLDDFVTAEEMGDNGAGRGVQNPDEVLGVLSRHLTDAKNGGQENGKPLVNVPLSGADIEKIMKEQANQGSFDWKKSSASVDLILDQGRIHRFRSTASLIALQADIRGQTVKYSADVTVLGYNHRDSLSFTVVDEKTKKRKAIPIPEHIRAAIRAARGQ